MSEAPRRAERRSAHVSTLIAVAGALVLLMMAVAGLCEPAANGSAAGSSADTATSTPTSGTAFISTPDASTRTPSAATGNAPSTPSAGDTTAQYAAEPLAVQYTTPAGGDVEVDPQAVIYVQFNRPVATLTAIALRSDQQVLTFNPPVAGTGKWLTSSLYTFKPEPGLQPGTTYAVRVRADVSDQPDGTLAAPYDFTFTTILPAVAQVSPADNTQFVDPATDVRVTFNQAVNQAEAQAAFSLSSSDGAVQGTFSWPDAQTLAFRPSAPLPRGATLTATEAAGVHGATGDGITQQDFSATFTVAPVPRVVQSRPADGDSAAPLGGVSITFSAPMDHDTTEAAITLDPTPDADHQPYFYWAGDTQLNISFQETYSSSYRVRIGAGALDRFGMPIAAPYSISFTTMAEPVQPPSPPSISLLAGYEATLNAYLPAQIYLQSVNQQQVDFALYPIAAADFRLLDQATFDQRFDFQPTNPATKRWTFSVPDSTPNKAQVSLITLGDPLPSGGTLAPGFYMLDAGSGTRPPTRDRAFIEVTRTNLVVKRGVDGGLVWAVDLKTGEAVAGATATFADAAGTVLATGTTAADGSFAGGVPRVDPSGRTTRLYASVERADDVALATQEWTGSAGPYSFNVPVALYPPVTPRGYLYTDRPIYRAGETVHMRFILRTDDDGNYSIPSDAGALVITATDSRGNANSVPSVSATLDGFGSLAADLVLPAEAATGNYQIAVRRGDGRQVGSGSFLVAEFRAPEFMVTLDTDHAEYINGAAIAATAQADLFLGAHLAGADLAWTVNAAPYSFQPKDKQYDGFTFSDFELAQKAQPQPSPIASGKGTTDQQGTAPFTVPAQLGDYPASERFTITANVTDQNRQQVSASKEVIVHRAQYYAGLKPQQYLSSAGKPATLDVASVDTTGAAAGGIPLHIDTFLRVWKTTKEKNPDGSTRYVSTSDDTPVDARDLTTDRSGRAAYSFTPAKGGQYRITIAGVDAAGNAFRAATSIYITSSDFTPWRVDNDAKLDLVADKQEYTPGDTAHVLVPAPFGGATGLVTVERGRILTHTAQQFTSNSTVVDIPITPDMAPTVFVGVALFKPGQGPDDIPGYQVGYVKLAVSPAGHALNITLTPDRAKLGPGETVNVTVKTVDNTGQPVPAEVSLAMVDQAVLSLASDRDRSIFDYFWGPRSLGVGTGSTQGVSLNLANQKQAARPTAAAPAPPPPPPAATATARAAGAAANNATVTRSDFQNTAYWRSDVQTDASGTATVAIHMPDNLTTWRLAARGVTVDTAAGETQTSILTTKELVMRPVAPRFLTAGDHVRLEALITNNSDAPLDVTVGLAAEGIDMSGAQGEQRVSVAPGRSGRAAWDVVAGEATGAPAKLTFSAKAATGQADAVALTLPINERSTPETVASSGIVTGDSVQETVQVPGFARQDRGSISVQLNGSLSGVIKQASLYIERYFYEPADVTATRLLDRTAAMQTALKLQQPQQVQDDARTVAEGALRRLLSSQRGDGGWSWWPGCCSLSSPEITAQVLYALGAAKQAGLQVGADATARATTYLLQRYDRPQDALYPADPNTRAFWLLAIASTGNGSPDREQQLATVQRTLADSGKGALMQALLIDGTDPTDPTVRGLESELSATAIASASGTHWEDADGTYAGTANSTRATALVLNALLRLDPNQPLLDGAVRWLSNARANGYWRSIRNTTISINAIAAFVVAREQPLEALGFTVDVNGRQIGTGSFDPTDPGYTAEAKTSLLGLPTDTDIPVTIDKSGGGQLYYSLFMRYFSPTDDVPALSNGVTIGRELLPQSDDTPSTTFKAGDLVRVHLTIAAPSDLQFVQVEDFLPAGLEAVDSSLKITDPNLVQAQAQANQPGGQPYRSSPFEHVEVRDDRVALFATNLSRGVHEYIYFARATTSGTFMEPPAVAQETDFPDVFGRSDSSIITIVP